MRTRFDQRFFHCARQIARIIVEVGIALEYIMELGILRRLQHLATMKMNIDLTVQLIGPDAELEAVGESYAIYRRKLVLEMAPHAGLIISLGSNLQPGDSRVAEFGRLLESVAFKPMHLTVRNVIVEVDMHDNTQIRVRAEDIIENTLSGFKDLERMLLAYYGFDRIV